MPPKNGNFEIKKKFPRQIFPVNTRGKSLFLTFICSQHPPMEHFPFIFDIWILNLRESQV